jgi:hypothetical protein
MESTSAFSATIFLRAGNLVSFVVTAQVRLDSFRQTTVQNFLDSGF